MNLNINVYENKKLLAIGFASAVGALVGTIVGLDCKTISLLFGILAGIVIAGIVGYLVYMVLEVISLTLEIDSKKKIFWWLVVIVSTVGGIYFFTTKLEIGDIFSNIPIPEFISPDFTIILSLCCLFWIAIVSIWYFAPRILFFIKNITMFLKRFLIHPKEKTICVLSAVIGAGVGIFFNSPLLGAGIGGIMGILNYWVSSIKILKLKPVT